MQCFVALLPACLLLCAAHKACERAPAHRSAVLRRDADSKELLADAELLIHTPAFLGQIGQQKHRGRLMNFIQKLDQGQNLTIAVFGGSMVKGQECVEGDGDNIWLNCAYSNRIAHGLEKISNSAVQLYNYAVGGTTTVIWVPETSDLIHKTIPSGKPDLIIIDFSVNDHHLADDVNGYRELLAAHEVIVRHTLQDFPDAVVFQIDCYPSFAKAYTNIRTPFSHNLAYRTVASYYGIELIDFIGMYEEVSLSTSSGVFAMHAPWTIHELVSKVTLQYVKEAWASYCESIKASHSHPNPATTGLLPLPAPLSEAELFREYDSRVCNPTTRYDALARPFLYAGEGTTLDHTVAQWKCMSDCEWMSGVRYEGDCWKLRPDTRWKPGWIAEHTLCAGSSIVFPLKFGDKPRLSMGYMTTHEKISAVVLTIDGQVYSQKVVALNTRFWASRDTVVAIQTCVPVTDGAPCDPTKAFVVNPYESLDLRVTLLCDGFEYCKFNLLNLIAC